MTTEGGRRSDGRREVITSAGVAPALGPYSQAVRGGGMVFVSGQAGLDPSTGRPAGDTFPEQARQAVTNMLALVGAGGSAAEMVLNTTVLLADFADFAQLNEIYAQFFPTDPPARMTMQVPLPAGILISIGCVALVS
jgi:2-iminobutanoate/2-iminopropanoate deaminase